MTTSHRIRILILTAPIACLLLPATAGAQSSDWQHGTTLSGFAGVSMDGEQTGSAFGGAIGWELTPRVAIEGSAAWLDRGVDAQALSAALKLRAALFGRDRVSPFVTAGIGAYRASYSHMSEDIPAFHRARMAGPGPVGQSATFTDPALVFGGGVRFFVSRHIALRPDVESMLVLRDSRHYFVTTAALQIAFHFEDHPVTPARGR